MILVSWTIILISRLFIRKPLTLISSTTFFNKIVDLIFLNFWSLSENFSPISPNAQAPRIASITACKTGSPSEWPNVPIWDGILIPPKYKFLLGTNLWTSKPKP